jgi:nitroreductase
MTRSFRSDPVGPDRLGPLFADALRAPSAGFAQAAEFLVLTDAARRATFWELVSEPQWRATSPSATGLLRAPVVALCLVDPAAYRERYAADDKSTTSSLGSDVASWPVSYPAVDAAFATMIVLLGAEAAGLGALFFQLQGRERAVLRGLDIPDRFDAIGAIAIGERDGNADAASPARIARRGAAERIHFEQYGAP